MKTIENLRRLQQEEMNANFPNGQFYNDLEDMIYKLENNYSEIETEIGEMYGARQLQK